MSTLLYQKEFPFGIFQTWDSKPDFECFRIHQVHGVDFCLESVTKKSDGIYGNQTKPWAIVTADCLPVLIHGKRGFVFFHAGWRGLAQAIHLTPQVQAIEPQLAFVGPHIKATNFEIGDDFLLNFPGSSNFGQHSSGKKCFDLLAELSQGLQKAYPNITVDDSQLCTFENNQFHSYRLDKTDKRNWNVFTSSTITTYNTGNNIQE